MAHIIDPKIKEKYKQEALIVPNYDSRKKEYYSIDDLDSFDSIRYFLGEVNDHEADLTEQGINFFREAFGLENLAKMLYKNGWYSDEFKNSSEILEWLKWWEQEARKNKTER